MSNKGKRTEFRRLRQERGLSLKDICNTTGISVSKLSDYERGKASLSTVRLSQIAVLLDVHVAEFHDFEMSPFPVRYSIERGEESEDKYGNTVVRYTAMYLKADGDNHYLGHFFVPVDQEKPVFFDLYHKAPRVKLPLGWENDEPSEV